MLANVSLLSGLKKGDLDILAAYGVTKGFPRNAVVITEGDTSDSLYLIIEGRVKVYLIDDQGREVILRTQGPGEYFGELALVDEEPRSASVMTLEPSKLCIISRAAFHECLSRNPGIAMVLVRHLSRLVRSLTENVRSLALLDVYGRVARLLLELAVKQGDKLVIEARPTHQEIANRVGASREMVSRIMKDLVAGGYVQDDGKRLVIPEKFPPAW
ncbi:MAG: Crp/Fnr family transcriptional regulator [Gammaproteobacteria bacterium]|nr:Crp/Fnr family transcriptional regulator [Gammaproteobacteria bacterium]